MGELKLTGEILAGLLLVVLLICVGLVLRRRAIARGGPVMLLALSRDPGWSLGLARVTASEIAWFPLLGWNLRPRERWIRGDLDLGSPDPIQQSRPIGVIDPVKVICNSGAHDFIIALSAGDYTALRSWSESAPPGLNANVA